MDGSHVHLVPKELLKMTFCDDSFALFRNSGIGGSQLASRGVQGVPKGCPRVPKGRPKQHHWVPKGAKGVPKGAQKVAKA